MNDIELINLIKSGNHNLYADIMNKYHNEIFKYVYNMINNYEDTEDLLQEIFFKIFKNLKKFDENKASFRTWVYRVAKNHVLNYLNSSKYKNNLKTIVYEDKINSSEEDIEEKVINNEKINKIIAIMKEKLSNKHFKIMHLYYFSNLTVKEISETLEIPDKTIYKAIKSSVEKIKKEVTY